MTMMKTASACGAVLIALVVAGLAPARVQQGKFDLLIRGRSMVT